MTEQALTLIVSELVRKRAAQQLQQVVDAFKARPLTPDELTAQDVRDAIDAGRGHWPQYLGVSLVWRTESPRALVLATLDAKLRCFITATLALEFERVLGYPRIAATLRLRGFDPADVAMQFRVFTQQVSADPLPVPVCRDPDVPEKTQRLAQRRARLILRQPGRAQAVPARAWRKAVLFNGFSRMRSTCPSRRG